MDSKKPLSIDRTDYPGNHETTPYVDVDAQPRAFLTLCEPGDVSQLTQVPADSFAAESGYEYALSSRRQHRYQPFRPASTLQLQTQRLSGFAQIQRWDEQITTIMKKCLSKLLNDSTLMARPVDEVPLQDWLRAAIWWAVQGRSALETQQAQELTQIERDQDQQCPDKDAMQGLVNLAKAWWICHHVVTQDDFKIRMAACRTKGTPDSALFDQYRAVLSYLRGYERQMAAVLCTVTGISASLDVDRRLWIFYPTLGVHSTALLDNSQRQAWEFPSMAFSDTGDLFCYISVIAEATLVHPGDPSLSASTFECIFSIMRGSESWQTIGVLASQIQLIRITIQSERAHGPVWKDIEWDVSRHSMVVCLHHSEMIMRIKLNEEGFASIWRLAHEILATEADLVAGEDESLLFDETVKSCQYVNHEKPVGYPAKPVAQCRVRLLKKFSTVPYGKGTRKVHDGLRIIVATPPHTKTQHRVTHRLPNNCPLAYSLLDGQDRPPGLLLHLEEACSVSIYFEDPDARTLLHSLLLDCVALRGETEPKTFLISSYTIDMQGHEFDTQASKQLDSGESQATVIEEESDLHGRGTYYGKNVLSEYLRIIVQNDWGSITDRLNIGPGQLTIALPILDNTTIHLHRLPQEDLSMTVAHGSVSKDDLNKILSLLQSIQIKSSMRIIKFKTQEDLHVFQEAVTGFSVRFDGLATRFLIARRRKLLSLIKQWDTNLARVQLLQQGGKVQVIAFFHQFRHWKCLNFEITALDEFEKMEQKDEYGVRIKDAKYALPQLDPSSEKLLGSVCLDKLQFPTEHSDIAIMFGDVVARDTFAACLPGLGA